MRPLILHFAETHDEKNIDFSIIEYSSRKNLSVIKNTEIPAISYVNMDTQTNTKTINESSDSDINNHFKLLEILGTSTQTLNSTETSDADYLNNSLKLFMSTKTLTESRETTDSDR
ncbi:hypothetical protein G9H64_13155 [Aquirufa nivalisilvae]|uniref:hypothetical protein n=1 Tax=Aquirufa nivalisilvae TaxID=2516557 RepID=UPI0022A8E599|nr:hypothetical protein [Aquirufa nivalisilvae]MCZ2483909.1 hypothetical protein [Aquirufa nivalisilvae]